MALGFVLCFIILRIGGLLPIVVEANAVNIFERNEVMIHHSLLWTELGINRVSRVSGGKYDQIRVSKVWRRNNSDEMQSGIDGTVTFPFRHRWNQFSFSTKIISTPPRFPKSGAAVRGIMLGDICFSSKYIPCTFGKPYGTLQKITWMLNTLANQGLEFWALLGDNFYDEDGDITEQFFSNLSPEIQTIPLLAVPGNHDFWTRGSPSTSSNNQFGYGYAQYYMMDTESARAKSANDFPFNFPNLEVKVDSIPEASNFFHYSAIGGAGFIAFSGGHEMNVEMFERACKYFWPGQPGADVGFVFLLSHWSSENLGCQPNMYSARVHDLMMDPNGPMNRFCHPLAAQGKLFYVDGHFHENRLLGPFGVRVGGQGMLDTGSFGFPLFQVIDDEQLRVKRLLVSYIGLAHTFDDPLVHIRFSHLKMCSAVHGIFGCLSKLNFVQIWLNVTTPLSRASVIQ